MLQSTTNDFNDLPEWNKLNEEQKLLIEKRLKLRDYLEKLKLFREICDDMKKPFLEVSLIIITPAITKF
jgi:hypothetical protein